MSDFMPRLFFTLIVAMLSGPAYAVDSYRFIHVTIETPWMIFLFLLCIVLFPFVLTAILHWHFANKKELPQQPKNEN
jgi:hypothetical protein